MFGASLWLVHKAAILRYFLVVGLPLTRNLLQIHSPSPIDGPYNVRNMNTEGCQFMQTEAAAVAIESSL